MSKTPTGGIEGPDEHGPVRAERIKPGNYTAKFLSDLKAQHKIVPVDEGWDPGHASLPPQINWVIYPNGELERVGFD